MYRRQDFFFFFSFYFHILQRSRVFPRPCKTEAVCFYFILKSRFYGPLLFLSFFLLLFFFTVFICVLFIITVFIYNPPFVVFIYSFIFMVFIYNLLNLSCPENCIISVTKLSPFFLIFLIFEKVF